MKRFPKYLLISLITFFIGLFVVSIWFLSKTESPQPVKNETIISVKTPLAEVTPEAVKDEDEFREVLDNLWIEDEKLSYEGFNFEKKELSDCVKFELDSPCWEFKVKKKGKTLFRSSAAKSYWIKYGFFNLLGKNNKQLIIHTFSGGAHCCYDYIIYDLKPTFRVIYDSRKFKESVGNELIPVDINGDGVFEFQQDVMAFDYMAPGGHATSTFPPAVFSYDKQKQRYEIANKRFPNYVLDELNRNLAGHDKWVKDNARYGTIITQEELDEIIVREKTLYLIYAGKEKEGWKFFNENYKFQFREKFKKEIEENIAKDPTYLAIYK